MGLKRTAVAALMSAVLMGLVAVSASSAQAQVDRPPQYVLLAFDGSSSIAMWKATRDFATRSKLQGAPAQFTYFISGVYYVSQANKSKYIEPTRGAGVSAIGWGGSSADLLARYDQTNLAHDEHNEIASHANAHFSGDKWTLQNWRSEFKQFHTIIFDFFNFNKLQPTALYPKGWKFAENSMVGFRAPQLGVSAGLWETLREFGYRYDTSKTSRANYWPERDAKNGYWNFPLAQLVIAGTGKKTLSMDYNFYFADSKAQPDPANKARYKKQMLETYLQYFDGNYNGNRAPIHIGHHFSLWNGGAYWEAMQEFALAVCGRPEVKCVTYTELADFMDTRTPAQLKAYQAGNFPKLPTLHLADGVSTLELDVRLAMLAPGTVANRSSSNVLALRLKGLDSGLKAGDRVEVYAHGEKIAIDRAGRLDSHRLRRLFRGGDVALETTVSRDGQEIARATQVLRDVGRSSETLSLETEEEHVLMGDMPEAHIDEHGPDGGI